MAATSGICLASALCFLDMFFYTSLYQVFENQHRTVKKCHAVVQHQTI